jgi:16S rRNA (guanine(966)-N(2))-methyltransferase RsmD
LRIIGGLWRGRMLRFPPTEGVRPTPDRVRETLFNWLGQDLAELATLDLFAGSGVLSLEALSRGAAVAVAVDRDPALIRALGATAATFGASGLEAHLAEAKTWIGRERRRFDVIFLDPPFGTDPWEWLLPACAARLAGGGFIYAEAGRVLTPPPALEVWRQARAGQVHYHLLRHAEPGAAPSETGSAS